MSELYVWGGLDDGETFDCSDFIAHVLEQAGGEDG